MTMKGGPELDSVKMLACMFGGCNIGLQWSINGVLIETFPLVMGSRAEGCVASKLGVRLRLMTMKGKTVLDSVKMLACMFGGCNIGLQWSINRNVPSCNGIESRSGCGFQTLGLVDDNERWNCVGFRKRRGCGFQTRDETPVDYRRCGTG